MWTDDEGMVNSRGRFDPVVGAYIKAIIVDIAGKLYESDGGRDSDAERIRSWDQRHADALAIAVGAEPGIHPGPGVGFETTNGHGNEYGPAGPVTGADGAADAGALPCPRATPRPDTPAGLFSFTGHGHDLSQRNQLLIIAETGVITGDNPDGRCEIAGVGPIPRSELERLACGADLFGVVFNGDGLPLWHGRKVRTVTPQQWRTLAARDRGCVLCNADPTYCHAHHIVPWTPPARGPTDIDNLALVCNRHHHHIHQHHLTLIRGPDRTWATSPATGATKQAMAATGRWRGS